MKEQESQVQSASDDGASSSRSKPHPFWRWFWLSFLVGSLAYAWHSFYVPSNDVDWADDITSARKTAIESGKPMLMFFTAEWCVPCRIMKREVFADPEVMTKINANVIPVMIYEGEPGANEAFKQYNVKGTPITILTDSQGEVIDYAVGGIDKAEFLKLLNKG